MKQTRIRFLTFAFAAVFLANGAMAAALACMVDLALHEHTATRVHDCGGDAPTCAKAETSAHYLVDGNRSHKADEKAVSFDPPAVAIESPLWLRRALLPIPPSLPVIASAPPVVGPPPTILFGNIRS